MASEKGLIVRPSKIYNHATSSSKSVGKINPGSSVDIIDSKSGWKRIFYVEESLTGWVRSYQIRTGTAAVVAKDKEDSESGGFFSGLASISRQVSRLFNSDRVNASNSRTATMGVRGLSEAELKAAKPDLNELNKMKQYVSSPNRVNDFVREGHLGALDVSLLE